MEKTSNRMPKPLKIIVIAVGGFVGLVVLAAVAVLIFVDANVYKPRLETAGAVLLFAKSIADLIDWLRFRSEGETHVA